MRRYTIEVGGEQFLIDVEELSLERFLVRVGGQQFEVRLAADEQLGGPAVTPEILPLGGAPAVSADGHGPPPLSYPKPIEAPAAAPPAPARPQQAGAAAISAPMPGTVLAVAVAPGDRVEAGQAVLTLEAMKMQNTLRAPRAGLVAAVLVKPGQTVAHGEALIQLTEAAQ